MSRHDDALELLLPDASAERRAGVRRVTSFLRLLVDDSHAAHARTLGVDLMRARKELESAARERTVRALRDLVRQYIDAAIPPESAMCVGASHASAQDAWTELTQLRLQEPELPELPRPGETTLAIAERLTQALERWGGGASEARAWRARWTRLTQGARAGEAAFHSLLNASIAARDAALRRVALTGVAECLFDRGAVRELRHLLREELARSAPNARLRLLLAWASVCLDDAAGARALLVGLKPWSGPLPASLVELRERRREWVPVLAGRARSFPGGVEVASCAESSDRGAFGGSVLAVFVFRRNEGAQCVHADVAPALRSRLGAWLADQETAVAVSGSLPHRVVVRARAVCEHRDERRTLTGVLHPDASSAVFVEPILDEHGEVAGWVHGELEHHLVPAERQRQRLAAAWREAVLRRQPLALLDARPAAKGGARSTAGMPSAPQPEGVIAERCSTWVDALAIKTAQRLWWMFDATRAEPVICAQGGTGQGLERFEAGRRKGLERALGAGAPVLFEEPDERLSVHARACSGLVLLLRVCGRTCGLLALESSRRRDFKAADLERLQLAADRAALGFRLAQFRAWHRERFGLDVWFDVEREDFASFVERLILAARARSSLVVRGPAGVGKEVVARWIHFEGARADAPLRVVSCATARGPKAWSEELERGEGTLVVEDVELADGEHQDALRRHLDSRELQSATEEPLPRLIVTLKRPLADEVAAGRIRADLARRLERVEIALPPLRERREDILPLVECFTRRFAVEERLRAPTLDEEALALLWRQDWDGEVRELENVVYKIVLATRSSELAGVAVLGAEHVLLIARQHGLRIVRKIPSRHPRRSDLLAALRVSRTQKGRFNKTRAAMFLGWDPDTLVVRMEEAGIRGETECEPSVWEGTPGKPTGGDELEGTPLDRATPDGPEAGPPAAG